MREADSIYLVRNFLRPLFHEGLCSNNRVDCPRYRAKRLLDLMIVTLVPIPVMAIGAVSALLVLLEDGRPALFRQLRVGRSGEDFILLKLRTMTRVKRAKDTFSDPQDSPRIGRLLRRLSVDELPRLINGISR